MRIRLILALLGWSLLTVTNCANAEQNSILMLTGTHVNKAKVTLLKERAMAQNINLTHKPARELGEIDNLGDYFNQHQLVIFYGASERETKQVFAKYAPLVANSNSRFLPIKALDQTELLKGVSPSIAKTLQLYYSNGGSENMSRMVEFIRSKVFEQSSYTVKPPIIFPPTGIYHPDYTAKTFGDLPSYLQWQKSPSNKVVGVMFQRAEIESDSTGLLDETIRRLENKGLLVVPFFFELSRSNSDYGHLLQQNGKTLVDLIINLRTIHWASKRKTEFEKFGVPVMQALTYYDGEQQHWEQNSQGITPGMSPFQLVLPESAGVVDPLIIAAYNKTTGQSQIIDYQLQHMVDKAEKVINLKHKLNRDKKITVMVWGNRDVGASFLNIPESLGAISKRLNEAGYNINAVQSEYFTSRIDRILNPFYRSYQLDPLIEDDLAELMPVDEYLGWFNTLPAKVREPINSYWGKARDNFMVVKRDGKAHFVLPRIRVGNMLVMRQPPRADNDEEDKRIYHKGTIPMNHYYLAAYFYARQYWASDAIVHLGTHGSHEYLPGKERGLSLYDQGNLAVWDTPVVYPFIVDDVGEAMQTKRRGRATVIAHMTPPFAAAGLQGDVADIHQLMHQYKSMDSGGVKDKTAEQITTICIDKNICEDINWSRVRIEGDFVGFIEQLHSYLEDLASQNQPLGLHTYGQMPEGSLLASTIVQMLGSDFVTLAAEYEQNHNEMDGDKLENNRGYQTVNAFVMNNRDAGHLSEALQVFVEKGRQHYRDITGSTELDNMLRFLESGYIPVKNGGDPVRNPDALPTGSNLYGFDPSRVPTKAAFEQGKVMTEQLIADYYQKHGKYPDKLAFSLWSMETMRHYGVLESQALYAMGLKPKWTPDGRVIGTEIIPASELKRPRVDVVLSATGLYRDAFPNVMQWMAKAIRQVAELKEANNSIWDNAQRVKADLQAAGMDSDEAQYLSTVRIFSNESGNYGSGLSDTAIASDTWETDDKLADLYLSRMGYFYGEDNKRWGQKAPQGVDLYSKHLSGSDIALFSRSSNVYGMLSSDDPFQYFGGLALAVRNIDGKSPEMYISNLRDAKQGKSENAATFLAKELRTRSLHPRWVEQMMKEGYSGAVSMSGNVSNFFGWQVMDPNLIRPDQWQSLYEVYIKDKHELGINEWFEQVDAKAQAAIIERMLEATRKEYWPADDATTQTLIERYQQLVNQFDLVVDNEKLREFVTDKANGFGLNLSLPAPEAAAKVLPTSRQVQGQQLEKVEQTNAEPVEHWQLYWVLGFCLLLIVAGVLRQMKGPVPLPQST